MLELTDNKWHWERDVAINYTIAETSLILGAGSRAWVEGLAASVLYGIHSTAAKPVDHEALVQYVKNRERRHTRLRARKALMAALEEHLTPHLQEE